MLSKSHWKFNFLETFEDKLSINFEILLRYQSLIGSNIVRYENEFRNRQQRRDCWKYFAFPVSSNFIRNFLIGFITKHILIISFASDFHHSTEEKKISSFFFPTFPFLLRQSTTKATLAFFFFFSSNSNIFLFNEMHCVMISYIKIT